MYNFPTVCACFLLHDPIANKSTTNQIVLNFCRKNIGFIWDLIDLENCYCLLQLFNFTIYQTGWHAGNCVDRYCENYKKGHSVNLAV